MPSEIDRSREGVSFTYGDSDESQLNVESLVLTIDGTEVEPTIDAADGVTTISYQPEMPWAFGSEHPWVLTALDRSLPSDGKAAGSFDCQSKNFHFFFDGQSKLLDRACLDTGFLPDSRFCLGR